MIYMNMLLSEKIKHYNEIIPELDSMYDKLKECTKSHDYEGRDNTKLKIRIRSLEGLELLRKIISELSEIIENKNYGKLSKAIEKNKIEESLNVYIEGKKKILENLHDLGSSIGDEPKLTFDEIAGLEHVKAAIKRYLYALTNPKVAKEYGINTNLGMLLYGPPGTGKTMIAEAIATELKAPFFVVRPSLVFDSLVGQSEKNIRDIFAEVRACETAVVLIDECESIFGKRESGQGRAEMGVANQLLQEMNGVASDGSGSRLIIGATNCPEMIDRAYLRHKRFSLKYHIGMPNRMALEQVISNRLEKLPHEKGLKEYILGRIEVGKYTGADVTGIIEQCAFLAMQDYTEGVERDKLAEGSYVKIGFNHVDKVMATFKRSVDDETINRYKAMEEFM